MGNAADEPAGPAPVSEETLRKALNGLDSAFANLHELSEPATLHDAELLVLPYGSAVPADAWAAIHNYLENGGNLLVLGGRPLTIPVWSEGDRFIAGPPETAYSREIGIEHTYEAPLAGRPRNSGGKTPLFPAARFGRSGSL